METTVLGRGISWLFIFKNYRRSRFRSCSFAVRIAVPLAKVLQAVLARTTHWRLHFVTLLVLAVCAIGERLGLPGPKTAFFLGLFMSRVEHNGKHLEEYLAPISQRFLIPIFFVALGMQIPINLLFSKAAAAGRGRGGVNYRLPRNDASPLAAQRWQCRHLPALLS